MFDVVSCFANRWFVTIWGWEWRQGFPTYGTAKQAILLWTWKRSTKASSGKKRSFHFSKQPCFQRSAQLFKLATLSCPSKSGKSLGKLTLTSLSLRMLWSRGSRPGMNSTLLSRPTASEDVDKQSESFLGFKKKIVLYHQPYMSSKVYVVIFIMWSLAFTKWTSNTFYICLFWA